MNPHNRLTKAYKGLTVDQLATLAFHYMTDANELEFERVASSVQRKTYTFPDVEYQARLDAFSHFSACWAIEHWRLRCRKAELLGGALAASRRGDSEKADALIDAHEHAEKSLLALDDVLAEICKESGISPDDVRKMAGTTVFVPMRENTVPDADMAAILQAGFIKLLGRK
jgi:hypothetical protein